MHLGRVLCALLCLLAVLSGGEATLSKKDKKGKKKKEQVDPICTQYSSVYLSAYITGLSCNGEKWAQGVVTYMLLVETFTLGHDCA